MNYDYNTHPDDGYEPDEELHWDMEDEEQDQEQESSEVSNHFVLVVEAGPDKSIGGVPPRVEAYGDWLPSDIHSIDPADAPFRMKYSRVSTIPAVISSIVAAAKVYAESANGSLIVSFRNFEERYQQILRVVCDTKKVPPPEFRNYPTINLSSNTDSGNPNSSADSPKMGE